MDNNIIIKMFLFGFLVDAKLCGARDYYLSIDNNNNDNNDNREEKIALITVMM